MRWSLPLQDAQHHDRRLLTLPPLDPTREGVGGCLKTLLAPMRPRDRKWMDGETWEGVGRHGRGNWEEEMHLEALEVTVIVDDGLDEFDERLDPADDLVDDEVDDQEAEDRLLEDRPLRPRR